jgi:molecular chaperone DnaJ
MSQDFYDILGVSRDASEDEITEAYRKKAREYHPDVSDDPDAEEKFKNIKKAKEVLTDEQKRRQYDQMGHDRFEEAEKHGATGDRGGGGAGDPFNGGGFDMGDLFDQFFGGGGRSRSRGSRRKRGRDLQTQLQLDLEEVYRGATKQVTITRPEHCTECGGAGHPSDSDSHTCPECDGRGQATRVQQTPMGRLQRTETCRRCDGDGTLYDETCSTCRGDGTVQTETTLEVEIPQGISDGQTLRMDQEGEPGPNGGLKGDLLIDVSVRDHPDFERDGDDLSYQHPISFPQAVFGDTITAPTLDGQVEVDIPEGTQSGEVFRLEGKGMPRLRRRGHGDLYVQVQVVTPEDLNSDQREALEQFAEAGGEEVEVEEGFFEKLRNSL